MCFIKNFGSAKGFVKKDELFTYITSTQSTGAIVPFNSILSALIHTLLQLSKCLHL